MTSLKEIPKPNLVSTVDLALSEGESELIFSQVTRESLQSGMCPKKCNAVLEHAPYKTTWIGFYSNFTVKSYQVRGKMDIPTQVPREKNTSALLGSGY